MNYHYMPCYVLISQLKKENNCYHHIHNWKHRVVRYFAQSSPTNTYPICNMNQSLVSFKAHDHALYYPVIEVALNTH